MGKKRSRASKSDQGRNVKKKEITIESLLQKHKNLSLVSTEYGDKIKCNLTQHEMKPDVDIVKEFLRSPKLKRALAGWYQDDWVEKYAPEIIQHKHNPKMLYCTVTKVSLNKIPDEVNAHVNGKKYQRALAQVASGSDEESHDEDEQ